MTTSEWIMIAAVVLGPIAAVIITLWHQDRKQKRDQKLTILRHALAFRHLPGDVNFSHAINMVPLEFAEHKEVVSAHKEFLKAASVQVSNPVDDDVVRTTAIKQTRLIYEMARAIGFNIRETDLQTDAYAASGFIKRDEIWLDAHRAWRDIANLLFIQARQSEGHPLTAQELAFLGIEAAKTDAPPKG